MLLFSHHTISCTCFTLENCRDLNISKKLNKIMKRSQENGILIKNLYVSKRYGAWRLLREFFTARRVCTARTMPWQDVCPSVCHTPVLGVNGFTHILKIFPPSGSPTILVFPYQTGWQYSDGHTLWAPNASGLWKNHDFRPISRFI